LAKILVSK